MLVTLLGYAPDLPSFSPGVITNCSAMVPSLKGMMGAPTPQNTGLPALSVACKGAGVLRLLDDSSRFIAGSATKLEEATISLWLDRSRATPYALSEETRWRFEVSGDSVYAAAKTEILQVSTGGNFSDIAADAPKFGSMAVVNGFLIGIDVNDQGGIYDSEDRPHGWWAARTHTNWTPSIANEAYTGSLTSTPGKNRAIKRFGKFAIIFKDRSCYTLSYAGQSGWEADLVPGEGGAMSQEAVIDVGTIDNPILISMGQENFYRYDGSRPVAIGSPLRKTVFGEINKNQTHLCQALHNRVEKNVYFFYPVGSSGLTDKCVVYNYEKDQWGRDDRPVEAVVEFIQPGITYDELGDQYSTYEDFPNSSYDTAFWSVGFPSPAVFNTSHKVQTLDGPSSNSALILGDYGSDEFTSLLSRAQPLFTTKPEAATMTNYYRTNLGDDLTNDGQTSMDSKGRFDKLRSANWHRCQFEFTGPVETGAVRLDMKQDGEE
jgi:hypothetical protein